MQHLQALSLLFLSASVAQACPETSVGDCSPNEADLIETTSLPADPSATALCQDLCQANDAWSVLHTVNFG